MSRPPTSSPSSASSAHPDDPPGRPASDVPGAKALAWAVVGLAALRRRKDQSTARAGPRRPVPPPATPPGRPRHRTGRWRRPNRASRPPHPARARSGRPRPADSADRPGDQAELPTQIPAKGWWQVTRRAFKEASADNVGILAGGIAYAALPRDLPGADRRDQPLRARRRPGDDRPAGRGRARGAAGGGPAADPRPDRLADADHRSGALSFSLVVSILLALWSASSGTSSLMTGINIAYDEQESRNFLKLRGTALLLTLGAIVFVLLTLALVAVVPAVLNALQLGTFINVIVQIVRWVLLVVLIVVALAVVYRRRARPRRPAVQVDQRRRPRRRGAVGARQPRLQPLRQQLRQLQQDLRRARRRRRPAAVAVPDQLHHPARRGDQRRVGEADEAGHHDGAAACRWASAGPRPPTPSPTRPSRRRRSSVRNRPGATGRRARA